MIQCRNCNKLFASENEYVPHTFDCPPPTTPCPQCARFREKIDREKMVKVAKKTRHHFGDYGVLDEEWADAFIKYLTE